MSRRDAQDGGRAYRGVGGNLLDGFLRPALGRAVHYRRAAGFFSSSVFAAAGEEFAGFFGRGGTMELVCSPVWSGAALRAAGEGFGPGTTRDAPVLGGDLRRFGQRLLTWALAAGRLHVKVAVVVRPGRLGIYHEKIGLLTAADGTVVGFEGSANESAAGFVDNFERVVVHPRAAATDLPASFEALWADRTPGLKVVPLADAIRRGLMRVRPDEVAMTDDQPPSPLADLPAVPPELLRQPDRLELRTYQIEAAEQWLANRGRGIFAMATGTGKTVAALATLDRLYRRVGPPLVVVIVAPYLHLVRQWVQAARRFGLDPVNCSGPQASWVAAAADAAYLVEAGRRPLLSLVATTATFAEAPFQAVLNRLRVRTVFVADEMHNLGSPRLLSRLPERVSLRLGLSATPDRHLDEDGSRALRDYFGPVVIDLDLAAALRLQPPVLTPYTYHPVLVPLDDEEREEYLRLTRQLARYMVSPAAGDLSEPAKMLLLKRARLVASARGKLLALRVAIAPFRDTRFNLVYCGDGVVDLDSSGNPDPRLTRQVEAAAGLLGQLGMSAGVYTSDVADDDRQRLLDDFEGGRTQALVAIRCLDEGVDIPAVRRAFILASSTNPRQFIQRRGRVLRRAEGKSSAEVYDFVVMPPLGVLPKGSAEYRVLRGLVEKEFGRVTEFARLAENGPQAHAKLLPVLRELDLTHL